MWRLSFQRIVGAVIVAVFVAMAQASPPRPDLESATKRWFGDQAGGAAVAYVDADGVVFANVGTYAPGNDRKISPDTTFEIGSITKVFTSLLLAEAERAGKLSRNDSAAKYLLPKDDAAIPALEKITLVSLATHSAGLPRMASNFRSPDGNRVNFTHAMLLAGFRRDGPKTEVGGKSVYSNFGVVLLGQAVAAAWGEDYPTLLQRQVLDPLELKETWLGLPGTSARREMAPGLAKGKTVAHWEYDALAPSGALRSTARDLAKFLQACLGLRETPLNASIRECVKPLRPMGSGQVGLNWMIAGGAQRPICWHNGGTGGFHAFAGFVASEGYGVVVLTNSDASPDALGMALLRRIAVKSDTVETAKAKPDNVGGAMPEAKTKTVGVAKP